MRKLIIIPTYNERENIEAMIDRVLGLPGGYELFVIDDGSPDGTAELVRARVAAAQGRLHLRGGDVVRGCPYRRPAAFMHRQHQALRLRDSFVEDIDQYLHHEIHGSEIVIVHDHTVMPGLPYIDPCLFPCLSLYCHDPLPASFPAVPICSAGTFSSLLTV